MRKLKVVAVTQRGRHEIEDAAPGHVATVRRLFIDRLTPASSTPSAMPPRSCSPPSPTGS